MNVKLDWMARLLAAALIGLPLASVAQERPEDRSSAVKQGKDPGHTGDERVRGESRSQTGDTGPAGPGIEQGKSEGLAGGRTDRGPTGEVGMPDDHTTPKEAKARANAAHRKAIKGKGAPQRADVEGGGPGTHELNYAQPLPKGTKKIPGSVRKKLPDDEQAEQPGGAATSGSAGHTGDPGQPPSPR